MTGGGRRMTFDFELVGKIGSMALIDRKAGIIDYTRVARLSRELRPGYIWVSSGATEIGRLDYMQRTGREIAGEHAKTDYAAQGQAILMQTYRQFVDPRVFGAAGARRTPALQRRAKERALKGAAAALPRTKRHSHRQLQRRRVLGGEQALRAARPLPRQKARL